MSQRPGAGTPAGTSIHVDYRKWIDGSKQTSSEHWQERARWLGVDEYGAWLGLPPGTITAKPSVQLTYTHPHVKIITDDGWAANICRPPGDRRSVVVYADMINIPEWVRVDSGFRVTMIDLDLDVIEWTDGTIMIDDEDEFAEHQVSRRYPAQAVTRARTACTAVERLLQNRSEPFRQVADRWLEKVGS